MASITYKDKDKDDSQWYPSYLDESLTHSQFVHALNTSAGVYKGAIYKWKEEGKEEELWEFNKDTRKFEQISPKPKEMIAMAKAKPVEDVMDYKTALEWMTLNPKKELVDDVGNKYMITNCQLHMNGVVENDPFVRGSFKALKLRKYDPPTFIQFWEAVKALTEDKIVCRYSRDNPNRCIDTYRLHDGRVQYYSGSESWINVDDFFKYISSETVTWTIKETA